VVEARFEIRVPEGTAWGSGLGVSAKVDGKGKEVEADPFADDDVPATPGEERWGEVNTLRRIVAGKYDALTTLG
jgi:hypothetical protein